jgi:hypothetical protein
MGAVDDALVETVPFSPTRSGEPGGIKSCSLFSQHLQHHLGIKYLSGSLNESAPLSNKRTTAYLSPLPKTLIKKLKKVYTQ